MSKYDSKSKFKQFSMSSHYLRVDNTHSLELFIGMNDYGQKTLRFIGKYIKEKIKGSKTILVSHHAYSDKLILSFSLIDNDYIDLFYLFCDDLIDSSRHISQEDGYKFLMNRFAKWRDFGASTNRYLSENQVRGLIGELLFMNEQLFDKYGVGTSILGWTGTEPLKKDYSFNDAWYEVKTVSNDKVTISSIEQLDSNSIGYLILYYLEKMSSEANDISINKLVDDILSKVNNPSDKSIFILKLVQAGYYKEEYYDQYVYRKIKENYFYVSSNFPKVNREDLPAAISNVKYDLIINMLDEFKRDSI